MSATQPISIGIDASNIRAGGGITHLFELLSIDNPERFGVRAVVVWGDQQTLNRLPDKSWLVKKHDALLDRSLPARIRWQICSLHNELRSAECDILLVPGGQYLGPFRPFVTMSQNMLPFQAEERARYGVSRFFVRLYLLYLGQKHTFQRADGVIFLSHFAQEYVFRLLSLPHPRSIVIPHGVNSRFFLEPREQFPYPYYSRQNPIRVLYVSTVNAYKHQWNVVDALALLRHKGLPVDLDLIGSQGHPPSLEKLEARIQVHDPNHEFVHYHGEIPFGNLHRFYHTTDIFVFASSCENLPNILLEAMASGLPIACSDRGPMPETLGNAGVYFNPEDAVDIANKIEFLISNPGLRYAYATAAYDRAQQYGWMRCTQDTYEFLNHIVSLKKGCA